MSMLQPGLVNEGLLTAGVQHPPEAHPAEFAQNNATIPWHGLNKSLLNRFATSTQYASQLPTRTKNTSHASINDSHTSSVNVVEVISPRQRQEIQSVNANQSKISNTPSKPSVKKKKKKAKKPSLRSPTMISPLLDLSEKQYQCPSCPRKFSWHFQLQQHTRTHSGERPFVCSDCDQAYKRREHLQRHSLIHTGERPFKCEECGKKYRRKSQLVRHSRAHTDERPYECNICTKKFRRKGHLSRHQKTHSSEINPLTFEETNPLLSIPMPPANPTSTT